jgi:hypothetical protein
MLPPPRCIIRRVLFQSVLLLFNVFPITLFPLLSSAEGDVCSETDLYIKNLTTLDVWYARNGGACTFWPHDHILILKPGETLLIYQDMTCKTVYCSQEQSYDNYKSLDVNHNCRVRILPDCKLSDM